MNKTLITTGIKLFGPKLIRQFLTWLSAYFATVGLTVETSSIYTFIGSLIVGAAVLIWSVVAKEKPSDDTKDKLGDMSHALASFVVPALMGWMRAKGISITGEENAEQLGLMFLQLMNSGLNKPDVAAESTAKKLKLHVPLIIGLMAIGSLTSCSIHPFAFKRSSGGEYVSLGGSILSRSTDESAEATTSSGTRLAYRKTGNDETSPANTFLLSGGVKDITSALTR